MANPFHLVSCSLLSIAFLSCSSGKSGTTAGGSEPPPPGKGPASPCAFDRTLTTGTTSVRVFVPTNESCSVGTVEFEASVLGGSQKTFSADRDGTVADAWLVDLDGNGALDLVVATSAAGSGSYGNLIAFEASGETFEERTFAPLASEQMTRYRGKDRFQVEEGVLYRTFPLYEQGDPLANPTGGMTRYKYSFETKGWVEAP